MPSSSVSDRRAGEYSPLATTTVDTPEERWTVQRSAVCWDDVEANKVDREVDPKHIAIREKGIADIDTKYWGEEARAEFRHGWFVTQRDVPARNLLML